MNAGRAAMKTSDHAGRSGHQFGLEPARSGQAIEQHLLVEADHFDGRIDQFLALIISKSTIAAAHDSSAAEVQAGAGTLLRATSFSQAASLSSAVEKST